MEFFETYVLEWIGYLASFIILVSLVMKSIKRLRIINLFGATLFAFYGYFLGSYPVMIMNSGIVLINVYYINQMIKTADYFKVVAVDKRDEYLKAFIAFYKDNIERAMVFTESDLKHSDYRFFILRNMIPAGLFVVRSYDDETLEVTLDYATPSYQDFKTSAHVFAKTASVFKEQGYTKFITFTQDEHHQKYLSKMDFEETMIDNRKAYTKII